MFVYPIMFALALFLNMATALGFAATGSLGLGFAFIGLAIVCMVAMVYSMFAFDGGF